MTAGEVKRLTTPGALFALVFFLIFPPQLALGDFTLKTAHLVIGIPALLGLRVFFERIFVQKSPFTVLVSMTAGFVYLLLVSAAYGFKDTDGVKAMALGFALFFAGVGVVRLYQKLYGSTFVSKLLWHIFGSAVLHSAVIIATLASPEFRQWLYTYVKVSDVALVGLDKLYRFPGLMFSGFSILSTVNALMLVVGLVAVTETQDGRTWRVRLFFSIGALAIVIAILLSGRTGMVVLALGGFCYLIARWARGLRLRRSELRHIVAILGLTLVLVAALPAFVDVSEYQRNLQFAFEFYFAFEERGTLSTTSVDELVSRHFFLPDSTYDLVFGTSNFGRGEQLPYIASDVGYVTFIFGAGVLGLLLAYSFHFTVLYYAFKSPFVDPRLSFLLTFYVLALLIVNLKDYYFISFTGYSQIWFLLVGALFAQRRERRQTLRLETV